jgi:hypothetical protein
LWVPEEVNATAITKEKSIRGENGNLTAKITSFNLYGDLRIEFSENVNTNLNINLLNSSNSFLKNETKSRELNEHFQDLMDIYVKPTDNWINYEENFTMNAINLTWHATNFSGNILDLKIRFERPLELSPLPQQDTLIIWINPKQVLFKQVQSPFGFLHDNSTVLTTRIPKQQPDTTLNRDIDFATDQTSTTVIIIIAFQIVINTIFAGSFVYMASMINAL